MYVFDLVRTQTNCYSVTIQKKVHIPDIFGLAISRRVLLQRYKPKMCMCLIWFEPRPTVTVLHSKKECIYWKFFLGNSKFPLKSKPTITLDVQTKQLNYFRIAYRRYAAGHPPTQSSGTPPCS